MHMWSVRCSYSPCMQNRLCGPFGASTGPQIVSRYKKQTYVGILQGGGGDSDAKSEFFQLSPFFSKILFRRGAMLYLFGISKRRLFRKGRVGGGGVGGHIF